MKWANMHDEIKWLRLSHGLWQMFETTKKNIGNNNKKMLETTKNVISVNLFTDSMRQATVCDT